MSVGLDGLVAELRSASLRLNPSIGSETETLRRSRGVSWHPRHPVSRGRVTVSVGLDGLVTQCRPGVA